MPGRVFEAVAVEARGGLVQRHVVEHLRQRALVEVAADDRHRVDRRHRRHAQAAERRDQAAAGSVLERQVVDGRREDVGHLLGDQLLRRRHADVDGVGEAANRRGRLLAEGGVRLVGDDQVVRLVVEVTDMAGEPRVRLNRDRVRNRRLLAGKDLGREPVAVALRGQLADELADEQPAVREDEDAGSAGRLDETCCGDRLAGGRRVTEAVAAYRARVLTDGLELFVCDLDLPVLVGICRDVAVVFVLAIRERLEAVRLLELALVGGDERREHAGQRVHLVAAQLGARLQQRRLAREHALQAEHEREANAPLVRGLVTTRVDLGDRFVQGLAPGSAGGEHL